MKKEDLVESGVVFDAASHTYHLGDKELFGITQTLVNRAFPNTYAGIPEDVLLKAAERGTNIHETIQFCEENGFTGQTPEWVSYAKMKADHDLHYITHEYIVTDRERYASAIDLVMQDSKGSIILCDIKTTSVRHYENVTLQLSIYKRFFEAQNPHLKVDKLALVWLRGTESEYKELTPWADEILDQLFQADKANEAFDIQTTYGDLPQRVYDVQQYLFNLEKEVKAKSDELKKIKDGLCEIMLERGIKSFTTPIMSLTSVTPKPRKSFDSEAFKFEYPELFEKFQKESPVKPSVRITFKGE